MNTESKFLHFVEEHENFLAPLYKEFNEIYFEASISGEESLYKRAAELELQISDYYSNREKFEFLKSLKESGELKEDVTKRILDLLFNEFASHQVEKELLEEIVLLSNKLEEKYATFRAKINDKEISDNQIDDILKSTNSSEEAEAYWTASKQIGAEVAEEVLRLVKLRNTAAQKLGYENHHQMSLILSELNPEFLDNLFDELDKKLAPEFAALKAEIDKKQAERFGVPENELMPWHFGDRFFQSGPDIYKINFDPYYENQNIEELTAKYFSGIGLPINDLLEKSDLYEKENKYQHAYCTNIDREGDVRVLCNIKPNHRWMATMLHEFGHAVYDKFISPKLPWTLREPAHIFTTEAIAMLFGRFASSPLWIEKITNQKLSDVNLLLEESFKHLRAEQLIFARWVQVIYRFEKSMYANPEQDLNALWYQLVKKYQLIDFPSNRNNPDWASKIHVALYPAYYQNYMMGELLASQLYYYVKNKVLRTEQPWEALTEEKNIGEYFKNLFFSYGSLFHWNTLIEKATGEKLTPKHYFNQFVELR